MPLPPKVPGLFALLPLTFLAVMVVLGLVIETMIYDILLWETKIPLAALLGVAFVRRSRRGTDR